MGALAKWDPQDDILLKNAVEAGASLESLAKGAVNFTRKFILKELQDHWRALLYNPLTSAEASARIIKLESTKSNVNPNSEKDLLQSGDKGKRDSVRSRYYAMRKRVSTQPLENTTINGNDDSLANEIELQLQAYEYHENNNDKIAPFLSEEAGQFEPQAYTEDLIMSPKICPSLEEENKIQETESRENQNPGIGFRDPDPIWRSMQREKEQEVMSQNKSNEMVQQNNTEISDFMDFSMDFSLSFIDDKDIADTSCSMFLNSPHDDSANHNNNMMNNDNMMNNNHNIITGTETVRPETDKDGNNVLNINNDNNNNDSININDSTIIDNNNNNTNNNTNNNNMNDNINNNNIDNNDINININNNNMCDNNNNAELENLAVGTGEIGEKFMICVLNTQDAEIPDNDHVFFNDLPPFQNPNPNYEKFGSSSATQVSTERKGVTGDLIEIKAGDPLIPVPVPDKREGFVPLVPLIRTASCSSQECGTSTNPVQIHNTTTSNEQNPLLNENQKEFQLEAPVQVRTGEDRNYCVGMNGGKMGTGIGMAEQGVTSASLHQDLLVVGPGSDVEDEKVSDESDDEVPSFSDVEAMILEMDLSPYDQESLIAKEGMRFQSPDSRKSLIRLEQGTRAYMNRAILSRGAFAVLYGRHMKYFIKSPEVSIGRETEDIKVDIDLGKEGRANKISRRQAIIKMNENGSFHIKSIGKCPIFVNSKEVPAKKRINLIPGALIEIRDMRFIFEVNEKAVSRYIFTMGRTCDSQRAKFEWMPSQNL